jgi:hypothetical protein
MFSLDCLTSGAKSNILGYISLHPIPLVCSLKVVTHLVAFWMNGVSGSCSLGTVGHRLRPNNLDTTRFPPAANSWEPSTPYRIWPHHCKLKGRDHHPKKELDPGVIRISPFPHLDIHGRAGFCHKSAQSALPSWPNSAHTQTPDSHDWVFSNTG